MKNETKERVAFLAASLIELADMTESDLPEVIEVVGVDAIRELLDMASKVWQRRSAISPAGTRCLLSLGGRKRTCPGLGTRLLIWWGTILRQMKTRQRAWLPFCVGAGSGRGSNAMVLVELRNEQRSQR